MGHREPLPIDPLLPALCTALAESGRAVLTAPPGSGKTTRVPGAILDAGLAGDRRVLVLQPRRVAARLAARRVAWERGSALGDEVGYQVRFEGRRGPRTRIEYLTEGLLLRRLQADPFLEEAGCVVLDELHERSLHLDLALALLAEVREARPELKLVAMSATLDPGPVAAFLGAGCPVLAGEGRLYPVDVRYLALPGEGPLERQVTRGVRRALTSGVGGHVLAFLPGAGEIERTARLLGQPEGAEVLPLHGRLPAAEQDRALAPSARRKVVLATNIAETSVTLEGVGAVVDAGFEKRPRLDPALGLERLELVRIARDAADQRAGRAGRTGPGVAWRLWTQAEQNLLEPSTPAEVLRADLAPTVLALRAWGADPRAFRWLEAPPEAAIAAAEALLRELGALDREGHITPLGRRMEGFGVHPRLARVLVAGYGAGWPGEAAAMAARAAEPGSAGRERLTDLLVRESRASLGRAPAPSAPADDEARAAWLLAGFPDRVGLRRGAASTRYLLVGGRGAVLEPEAEADAADLILAVELRAARRGERAEHRISQAMPLERRQLVLTEEDEVAWDLTREGVVARRVVRYRDLVLEERPAPQPPDPERAAALLLGQARSRPERALQLEDSSRLVLDRMRFLAFHIPELGWPDISDLTAWLPDLCAGHHSFAGLRALDWARLLRSRLNGAQISALASEAPERWPVPSGSTVALRYPDTGGIVENGWARGPEPPVLAARIQQLFGLTHTPCIARGRAPLLVHLLAPNGRPAQVTSDLESFWRDTYRDVRKDLRGRYPKHAWPEDPSAAVPEDRPRRRR